MRSAPHKAEIHRIRTGAMGSDPVLGNNGAFILPGPCGRDIKVIASDGEGWEHVSASLNSRPPNWQEMCFVKDMFWNEDETVIQFHPPKSEYVNTHPNCLHLWRPTGAEIPLPPSWMVGVKDIANPTELEREKVALRGFAIANRG